MTELSIDVAIVGGGLAGNLVARQIRRELPMLSVAIFEKAQESSFKVGESTVEIASNYLVRRLGLSRYLYERQLPKNGLRFFFDTPERDGELEELSEIGSMAMPVLPSFQLDRSRFEADLWAMNEAAGVVIHRGRAKGLELAGDDGPHTFELLGEGDARQQVKARWLIDASGRAGLIAKKLDLWQPEDHAIAAVWGRFEGVADLDDIGRAEFHQRVRHTSRYLSTTHFCYPGYWIWFIPLGEGITSVGVVIERDQWSDAFRRPEGFEAFLRGHRAASGLLENARLVDVMSYKQLAYGSRRYFGPRWACVGEAAAFSDPFYSPGSDFIAVENDFVVDLIRRELAGSEGAGSEASEVAEQRERYDAFMRFRFEATMLLYRNLYSLLGSYELYLVKWDFDIACYYNLWLEPFMRDQHLDAGWLDHQLKQRPLVLGVLARFSELFQRVEQQLRLDGSYHRKNLGRYVGDFPSMHCAIDLGTDASAAAALDRTARAFNTTRSRALALLGHSDASELSMRHFLSGKPLL
jgi:flavin-dependent dehydrogenase